MNIPTKYILSTPDDLPWLMDQLTAKLKAHGPLALRLENLTEDEEIRRRHVRYSWERREEAEGPEPEPAF